MLIRPPRTRREGFVAFAGHAVASAHLALRAKVLKMHWCVSMHEAR